MARVVLLVCVLCEWVVGGYAQAPQHPCLPCHPAEVERFSQSVMGQSLSANPNEPDGHFSHSPSAASVTIYRNASVMHHKVEEHGIAADYPIEYAIGYGKIGRSYLIDLKGNLFQSPASFYTSKSEWAVSPGYETSHLLDFTRAITSDCISCHAGSIKQHSGSVALTPLSCDRCHGSAENHLKNPIPGSIVNPAKLPVRERDSVCEQCHLEGATAVLNPDGNWSDFRPGMTLESVESHYVFKGQDGTLSSLAAVSHAEQLAVSACARSSAGKLWCGTCHDPHGPKVNRQAEIRQICASCHATTQLAALHSPGQDDCVACHMPRLSATDISHAAVTDHRILKRPEPVDLKMTSRMLAAWHSPPPAIAQRNLGLAYFHVARQENSGSDYQRSFDLLSKQSSKDDPEVSAALAYMLLASGQAKTAIPLFKSSTDRQPDSAEYWLDLGVALETAGQAQDAALALTRSMQLAPYNYRPYKALSDLYAAEGQHERSLQVVRKFLMLVPQSLTLRLPQ